MTRRASPSVLRRQAGNIRISKKSRFALNRFTVMNSPGLIGSDRHFEKKSHANVAALTARRVLRKRASRLERLGVGRKK